MLQAKDMRRKIAAELKGKSEAPATNGRIRLSLPGAAYPTDSYPAHAAEVVSRPVSSVLDSRLSPRATRRVTLPSVSLRPTTTGMPTPVKPRAVPTASYAAALPVRFAPRRKDSLRVERPVRTLRPSMTPVVTIEKKGMESRVASLPDPRGSPTCSRPARSLGRRLCVPTVHRRYPCPLFRRTRRRFRTALRSVCRGVRQELL